MLLDLITPKIVSVPRNSAQYSISGHAQESMRVASISQIGPIASYNRQDNSETYGKASKNYFAMPIGTKKKKTRHTREERIIREIALLIGLHCINKSNIS